MGQVPAAVCPRWRGVELDELSPTELDRAGEPLIALDRDGRIVAMSAAAAEWAGVAAWQARGRELVRELGWRFGRSAVDAIAAFVRSSAACTAVRTEPGRRHRAADVALLRGDRRIYVALAT